MKRNVSLEEISDGKLYGRNDMVRAGCGDCRGCSACCHGMGESIILDPYDVWRLTTQLGVPFAELMSDRVELHVVDGIILPNLKMDRKTGACGFLTEEGRCGIHAHRPGICRLFPLGRYYEKREAEHSTFRYFLQVHECPLPNKTKVKVGKWVDTPYLERYESYIIVWHDFLEEVGEHLPQLSDEQVKNVNLFLLKLFFLKGYGAEDFYPQFEERMQMARDTLEDVLSLPVIPHLH